MHTPLPPARPAKFAAFAMAIFGALSFANAGRAAELPRDHIVLKSAIAVDPDRNTVVLPLYRGVAAGKAVYYILADSSDKAQATSLGINYAPTIAAAFAQPGSGAPSALQFAGAPDFSASRVYTPSASGFPPADAKPGSVADDRYSPFVKLPDGTVLDAPIVAAGEAPFDVATHRNTADRVLAIDLNKKTVTILLAHGFFNGSRVVYLSTDASDPGVATVERATYTKNLANSGSASQQPIVALANGQTGANNPQAQGLAYLALDGNLSQPAVLASSGAFGSPLNVLAVFAAGPSAAAYTPLWAANVGAWSKAAIAAGKNVRITSIAQAFSLAGDGLITSPNGKQFGPIGVVVNCPVIAFIDPIGTASAMHSDHMSGH
ncbi:MAG: hypothetical protein JO347_11995 [Candidatus Eremiobacteraeota bacterium]|nr:hypothetical protein [Candidatus Eremiobacteraeota bacterium]